MDTKIEDYLIALLKIAKEEKAEVNATKIQKIFFLLEREKGINFNLDFKPWLYGPYSEKLNDVLNILIQNKVVRVIEEDITDPFTNLIISQKRTYELNGSYNVRIDNQILNFMRQWVIKDRRELLKHIYSNYPEFLDMKEIMKNVLHHD